MFFIQDVYIKIQNTFRVTKKNEFDSWKLIYRFNLRIRSISNKNGLFGKHVSDSNKKRASRKHVFHLKIRKISRKYILKIDIFEQFEARFCEFRNNFHFRAYFLNQNVNDFE